MNKYFRNLLGYPEMGRESEGTALLVPKAPLAKESVKAANKSENWQVGSNISLVQEIHNTFANAMDQVLKEASIHVPTKTQHEDSLLRAKQLEELGFTSSLEVQNLKKLNYDNAQIIKLNEANLLIQEDIGWFKQKYPHYKFITEEALLKILDKYQLMHGAVAFFTGLVPDKNLQDLILHKIDDADKSTYYARSYEHDRDLIGRALRKPMHEEDWHDKYMKEENAKWVKMPLTVAATPDMFTNDFRRAVDSRGKLNPLVKDDPIVMQFVQREQRHYLAIITAWGPEANDVVNERMN